MNGAFYVGAIGLQAQQRALDVLSNNVANVNTPAFKRADLRFSEVLANRLDPDVPVADASLALALAGVTASARPAIDEAGAIETSGNPLDVAINGRGFIELMGPNGQTLLWRGGRLMVGEDGLLAAADSGLALKAAITVPSDTATIAIDPDGTVHARAAEGAEASAIGRIALVKVEDAAALTALDGGLYRIADDALPESALPGEDGAGSLVQGAVERSNVDLTQEMVQLLLVQRAYGANAQVVQAADQLMGLANGLRR